MERVGVGVVTTLVPGLYSCTGTCTTRFCGTAKVLARTRTLHGMELDQGNRDNV